ncbi:MAG: GNAT family N-acetyltransferase [Ktedonobacterales bacterium]
MSHQRQGMVKKQSLTQTELAEIHQLADICNTFERLTLKLNWEMLAEREPGQTNDFLYYEQDALIGFLPLFSFRSTEGEISGMVHPTYRGKGIFRALYGEARKECQHRGYSKLLIIVESASVTGQAFVRSLGATYSFSEYAMKLDEPPVSSQQKAPVHLRLATLDDRDQLIHITVQAFGRPVQEVIRYSADKFAQADHGWYVAELDGNVIGKIEVDVAQGFIHGFAVLPNHQGQGYGRQILEWTVQELLARGQKDISLEVAVTNKSALSLYQSCGFKETSQYDYYLMVP